MLERLLGTIDQTLGDPSFWIGLAVVFVFARDRFAHRPIESEALELPVPVRSFTTRFRYHFSTVVYGAMYSSIYVAFICLGAFPQAQDVIAQWFGSVGIDENIAIATPIGAAAVVTSVLPAVPVVRSWDDGVRGMLREFASIPLKVHYTADLVLGHFGIRPERDDGPPPAATPETAAQLLRHLEVYQAIKDMMRKLQGHGRLRAAQKYAYFFATYRKFEDELDETVASIRSDPTPSNGASAVALLQSHSVLVKLARYLVCALFVVEPDEYGALRVLSQDLGISNIQRSPWRFKSSQIVLGMLITFLFSAIGGLSAAMVMLYLSNGQIDAKLLLFYFQPCILVSLLLVPVFLVPLTFVAGAEMYMLDRLSFGERFEWDDKAIAWGLTFLGCLAFALFLTLVGGVLGARAYRDAVSLGVILPWALPPAAVAMTYFASSRTRGGLGRLPNAVIDFVLHALAALLAALLAQQLSVAAGLTFQGRSAFLDSIIYLVTEPLAIVIIAGLTGGSLGALQCAISRQVGW